MRSTSWLASGIAGFLAACGGGDPPPPPPLPVTVVAVGGATGLDEARYSATIKADESVDVAFRVSGVVDAITQVRGADGRLRSIQDGDPVRRGAVLARLRQTEHRDQVTEADADLRQATADYERASQLFENRSISKAEYDAAYARYTASQARRSQANISLGDATLRAPLDGVVLRRTAEVGSLAGPAAPAFTIADTRVVKVVFGVPDVVVARLELGETLPIQAEALPRRRVEGAHHPDLVLSGSRAAVCSRSRPPCPIPRADSRWACWPPFGWRAGRRSRGSCVPLAAVVRPPGDSHRLRGVRRRGKLGPEGETPPGEARRGERQPDRGARRAAGGRAGDSAGSHAGC